MNTKFEGGAFLSGLQLSDSALPIGRYAYSYGLESFLSSETHFREEKLTELISSLILNSIGPLDGTSVALSHRAEDDRNLDQLIELDYLVTVRKIIPSSRKASHACGRQLAGLGLLLLGKDIKTSYLQKVTQGESDGNIGIVMGVLASNLNLSCEEAVLIEIRDSAASLFSAAVRLGKISAVKSQIALKNCEEAIITACESALLSTPDSMYSTIPQIEIHTMLHEYSEVRMFRS